MNATKLLPITCALCSTLLIGCPKPRPPVSTPPKPNAGGGPPSAKQDVRRVGALTLDGIPAIDDALKRRMKRYLNARDSIFTDWDHRSGGMLIRTRFGNTTQVHRVLNPKGAREQLTFFDEPVHAASWVPDSYDNVLLLLLDEGGQENHKLVRRELLEGKTLQLTDSESRTIAFRWSPRGLLAYSNNARNSRDFDIYVTDAKRPESARLVHRASGLFVPVDFARDEQHLLIKQYISINDARLFMLDIKSKKIKRLPLEDKKRKAPVGVRDARFTANGKSVFFTADRQGEHVKLYRYDIASEKIVELSKQLDWNVEAIDLSNDGRTLAVLVNEDGYSRLYLLDSRSTRLKPVKLPAGIIRNLKFCHDKKRGSLLGFTLYSATSPANAYSYDTRRKKLVRWTTSEVGGLNRDFFVAPTLIRYPTFDKAGDKPRRIPAFYFKPPGAGPFPVLLHLHGGPESQFRPFFSGLFQYLLMDMGVAVLAPNVRGSDGYGSSYLLADNGVKREDAVSDVGALLDWIDARKELDPSRVIVHGGSYGGFMVLASMVRYAKRLRGGIDWVGISNFVTFLKNTRAYRRDLRRAEYGDERDPKIAKFLERISPLTNVKSISAPLLVIQGANDPRVPASEAEQIVRAVRDNNQTVWYLLAADEGHGFRKKDNRDVAQVLTAAFLERVGIKPPQ